MKLLGISFGKTMGNSEILLREALMGAEEVGAEVALMRALDFDIKPCNGCNACAFKPLDENGFPLCARHRNDDLTTFMNHFLDADALIFASPIYQMSPSGYMRMLCDLVCYEFPLRIPYTRVF